MSGGRQTTVSLPPFFDCGNCNDPTHNLNQLNFMRRKGVRLVNAITGSSYNTDLQSKQGCAPSSNPNIDSSQDCNSMNRMRNTQMQQYTEEHRRIVIVLKHCRVKQGLCAILTFQKMCVQLKHCTLSTIVYCHTIVVLSKALSNSDVE